MRPKRFLLLKPADNPYNPKDMIDDLKKAVKAVIKDELKQVIEPEISRPEDQFGDYTTNAALRLAAKLAKPPREIAERLSVRFSAIPDIRKVEIAGPGFINFWLSDTALLKGLGLVPAKTYEGQSVVVEYSDPNPFKVLHVGHLYTSVVGEAIARLFENGGAKVARVNFGGDVGLHAAKAMWAVIQELGGEKPDKLDGVEASNRAGWLAACYAKGNDAYEEDPSAKAQIEELNGRLYALHEQKDHDSALARIYWTTRQWSYDYFDDFYAQVGTKFDRYYPESETVEPGLKVVKENIGKVFEESDGAVVFKGEVHNMHTRVFINSQGLPTYETKDVGLIVRKWEDYHFDRSIIITGNEQAEYMAVVLAAVGQIMPELAEKTTHITHGLVKMAGGQKMSSRKGNVILALDVLDAAAEANKNINGQDSPQVSVGAVKYAFLKNRIGGDMVFNPAESVSIEGNSGPYLQYAHARACSILTKTGDNSKPRIDNFDESERSLARKISEYPEVVQKASLELLPHHICTYLYELAQNFNRFYEKSRIIGDEREAVRLELVKAYKNVLKKGLSLLNIEAPERM